MIILKNKKLTKFIKFLLESRLNFKLNRRFLSYFFLHYQSSDIIGVKRKWQHSANAYRMCSAAAWWRLFKVEKI